ncbi:MAG: hypothetical protein D6731_01435 [Planctomycetota bacterium]|nr:MAG: hypothetical protein D6731_01435 [Planctomycetota bacterium]
MLLPVDLEAVLDALEGHYVLQALSRGSSQREAGALLGLDRFALARRRSRLRHRGGRKAVARILAEAPQWLRDIMLPHPGDLPGEGLALLEVRSQLESRAIAVALRANGGNRARAATVLGMSRTSLNRRLA